MYNLLRKHIVQSFLCTGAFLDELLVVIHQEARRTENVTTRIWNIILIKECLHEEAAYLNQQLLEVVVLTNGWHIGTTAQLVIKRRLFLRRNMLQPHSLEN